MRRPTTWPLLVIERARREINGCGRRSCTGGPPVVGTRHSAVGCLRCWRARLQRHGENHPLAWIRLDPGPRRRHEPVCARWRAGGCPVHTGPSMAITALPGRTAARLRAGWHGLVASLANGAVKSQSTSSRMREGPGRPQAALSAIGCIGSNPRRDFPPDRASPPNLFVPLAKSRRCCERSTPSVGPLVEVKGHQRWSSSTHGRAARRCVDQRGRE